MVGHNASGFDIYLQLNSLQSSYECVKILKTSRGIKNLSFKTGSVLTNIRKFLNKRSLFVLSVN